MHRPALTGVADAFAARSEPRSLFQRRPRAAAVALLRAARQARARACPFCHGSFPRAAACGAACFALGRGGFCWAPGSGHGLPWRAQGRGEVEVLWSSSNLGFQRSWLQKRTWTSAGKLPRTTCLRQRSQMALIQGAREFLLYADGASDAGEDETKQGAGSPDTSSLLVGHLSQLWANTGKAIFSTTQRTFARIVHA